MSIPAKMNALVLHGVNDLRFEEVPVPEISDDEVLVKIAATTICGTDPHIIEGAFPGFWPTEFPIIIGHEWSGTVAKAGAKAEKFGWKEGDRICGSCHVGCGYCEMCLEGRYNLCENYGIEELGHRQYGHYLSGSYAQYYRTSVKSCFRIPDSMDLVNAASIDPLSVSLHTVRSAGLKTGKSILVNGTGPLGLYAVKIAKAMGAGKIFASGSGSRLEFAEKLGAVTINYREEDIAEKVLEYTGGKGTNCVIDFAGTEASLKAACQSVAKGGTISMLGFPPRDIPLPVKQIVMNEITLVGNRANPNCAPDSIQMVAEGRVSLDDMVTHRFAMKDYEKAFETFNKRLDNSLKIAILPND